MALKFAIEPPVVSRPRADGGNCIQSRNQSSTLASSCTSAGAACQIPVNLLTPSAMKSASAAGYRPPPGMNARYPGDAQLNERGIHSSNSSRSTGSNGTPARGGVGARSARQAAGPSPSPRIGCAGSVSRNETTRRTTASPIRRISSGVNSRLAMSAAMIQSDELPSRRRTRMRWSSTGRPAMRCSWMIRSRTGGSHWRYQVPSG